MGQLLSKNKHKRILVLGLDGSGKTSLVQHLLNDEKEIDTTSCFEIHIYKYKSYTFHLWDIGGKEQIRPLWKHYYDESDAVIYVIDGTDMKRWSESIRQLYYMMYENKLYRIPFLVYISKQDLGTCNEIPEFSSQHNYYVQPCSMVTGEGVKQGLKWLCGNL
jgi:small GTP-binding protein